VAARPTSVSSIRHLFPSGTLSLLEAIEEIQLSAAPEELKFVARAVPKRRREFLAGRTLSRRALAQIGLEVEALAAAEDRRPIWPPGVVGSISHSDRWCGVVVARRHPVVGLGLDVEDARDLAGSLWPLVLTPREAVNLRHLSARPERWALLVFSAKESIYKCLSPRAGEWLDFTEVEIDLDLERARFSVVPMPTVAGAWRERLLRIEGRFSLEADRVVTSAILMESRSERDVHGAGESRNTARLESGTPS
jgi:4'-phosphopantetheinyl transferase EntD